MEPKQKHGNVLCGYRATDIGDERILQLGTYGSEEREIPGKVSQTFQIDIAGARRLKDILERSFPDL